MFDSSVRWGLLPDVVPMVSVGQVQLTYIVHMG